MITAYIFFSEKKMGFLEKIRKNRSGSGLLGKVIGISVGLMIASVVLVQSITNVVEANVTGWDASLATMFQILVPMLAIVGLVILIIKYVGVKGI